MNVFSKLTQIKGIVFDVDGVFTDNNILITEDGAFLRQMNVRDGYAIKRAIQAGLKLAVISGGKSAGIVKRLNILGIDEIHLGIDNKLPVFNSIVTKWNIPITNIAYMGDDIPDLECLKIAGLPSCPKDAVGEILEICSYVSIRNGGEGCVRLFIEQILQAQDLW